MIREKPLEHWRYISREFRRYFAKKIVVVGPESTGKSTLVKDLAQAWNSSYVPEYGRILSEAKKNVLNEADFNLIATRHENMINLAIEESETGLVFIDTEAYTTMLYAEVWFSDAFDDSDFDEVSMRANFSKYHMQILLPPEIPWDDDGTRVMPLEGERVKFYKRLKTFFSDNSADDLYEVRSRSRNERVNEISVEITKKFLTSPRHFAIL
jgi:HTH-type transcriptional repressor of NAD biosynthesis genes